MFRTDGDVRAALEGKPNRRRPTDLATSADGTRIECAVGELIELRSSGTTPPFVAASNVAGEVTLHAPDGFPGVRSTSAADDVLSVTLSGGARTTLHADGTLRIAGERIARIDNARQVRASPRGVLAVVSEHEGASTVRLVDTRGQPVALLEGGLPLGGVAWAPHGERFAQRTASGIAIHDLNGVTVETISLDLALRQSPVPASRAASRCSRRGSLRSSTSARRSAAARHCSSRPHPQRSRWATA